MFRSRRPRPKDSPDELGLLESDIAPVRAKRAAGIGVLKGNRRCRRAMTAG